MSRKLQRKNTSEVTQNIAASLIDNKLKERYGTSIDEFISHDYNNKILQRVENLRNEFRSIGKDKDSFLSVDDITSFFNEKYPQVNTIFY